MVLPNVDKKPDLAAEFVCPVCFKPIRPAVIDPPQVASGILRRAYTAWCEPCGGHVVIQFFDSQRAKWIIEKHGRLKPLYVIDGRYTEVCSAKPLIHSPGAVQVPPEANPVIQTGPGGDYREDISDEQVTAFLNALKVAGAKIQEIIQSITQKP